MGKHWNNRCGYCRGEGHNRRSCPEIKKRAEEGNQYCKSVLEHNERVGKRRSCGYCHETGHNKKTCPQKKSDLQTIQGQFREYRAAFVKKANELGFDVGCLLRGTKTSYGETQNRVFMVTGFRANEIHATSQKYLRRVVDVYDPVSKARLNVPLPTEFNDLCDEVSRSPHRWELSIASNVDDVDFGSQFDHSWKDGVAGAQAEWLRD